MKRLLFLTAAALALSACTEKPQTLGTNPNAVAPYAGTKYPYSAPGWTAGDKKSWQEQLKVRTERGQNDYSRM
ncbi:MAG: hypothetical protein ABI589_02250 [Burkholderiales bacterium]